MSYVSPKTVFETDWGNRLAVIDLAKRLALNGRTQVVVRYHDRANFNITSEGRAVEAIRQKLAVLIYIAKGKDDQ